MPKTEQDEYKILLINSEAFNGLDEDVQKKILGAEGEEKRKYIKIFSAEQKGIVDAKKELIEKNDEVMRKFAADSKKNRNNYMKNSETKDRKRESKKAEQLLNSI